MPFHYTEERRQVLNHKGVLRGDRTLSLWFGERGAEHKGFTKDKAHRLWRSKRDLKPLADGVEAIDKAVYDEKIEDREKNKPPPPPPPPPHPLVAIRAMPQGLAKTNALIDHLLGV